MVLPDRTGLELRTKAVVPHEIVVPWMVQKHMRIHDAHEICKVLGVRARLHAQQHGVCC